MMGAIMATRDVLHSLIAENVKANYSKAEVLKLIKSVELEHEVVEVEEIRRGDVFWHKLVGGKRRPWIVLSVKSDIVLAVALSTGDSAPRMVQAKCRFWAGRWVGTTTTLVTADLAKQSVTRPYTDREHLREIEAHIAELYGLRTIKGRSAAP